jgi:hypothetical protein
MKIKFFSLLLIVILSVITFNLKLTKKSKTINLTALNSYISQACAQNESGGGCDQVVAIGWNESGTDSNGCTVEYYCEGSVCYPSGEALSANCYELTRSC